LRLQFPAYKNTPKIIPTTKTPVKALPTINAVKVGANPLSKLLQLKKNRLTKCTYLVRKSKYNFLRSS
jgi:hypothetical protein